MSAWWTGRGWRVAWLLMLRPFETQVPSVTHWGLGALSCSLNVPPLKFEDALNAQCDDIEG